MDVIGSRTFGGFLATLARAFGLVLAVSCTPSMQKQMISPERSSSAMPTDNRDSRIDDMDVSSHVDIYEVNHLTPQQKLSTVRDDNPYFIFSDEFYSRNAAEYTVRATDFSESRINMYYSSGDTNRQVFNFFRNNTLQYFKDHFPSPDSAGPSGNYSDGRILKMTWKDLFIEYPNGSSKIASVTIRGPEIRIESGIGIGSEKESVMSALKGGFTVNSPFDNRGPRVDPESHTYFYGELEPRNGTFFGYGFYFGEDDKVASIVIGFQSFAP